MSIYQSIKDFGKKALLVGGLVAVLTGCDNAPSQNASSFNKILKSDGRIAVLSTEVILHPFNSNIVNGTKLYLESDGNKKIFLETEDLITNIENGDLNNDGTEDFIVSYRMFHPYNRRKVIGTRSETYLSTGRDFSYVKK